MNCDADLLEPYLDEELDAAQRAAVDRHMAECADCSSAYARLREQKAGIRAAAPYYNADPEIHQSIRAALRDAARSEPTPIRRGSWWRPVAIAASILLAVSLSWNARNMLAPNSAGDLANRVLDDHLRSLIGTHLVDVLSSDQHTVKPWFAGKLDFSPTVKNLDSEGFPLEGGRVDYLDGRRVAALVYRRRQHIINLFVWPAPTSSARELRTSHNGYNLLHWTSGPMTYWAVSDVSATDLDRFRKLYEQ